MRSSSVGYGKSWVCWVVGLIVVGTSLFVAAAPAAASGRNCAATVLSENVAGDAVQAAVNAHPGQVVCVGPGTFPEQIVISSSGTTLLGAGGGRTIFAPVAPLVVNTYNFDARSGPRTVPAAAIVLIAGPSGDPTTGVSGVTLRGITVDGSPGAATFTNCSVGFYGVDFQASSGSLVAATVTNVAQPLSLFGCQTGTGLAILAYNGFFNFGAPAQPVQVNVSQTVVTGYQKNGITCRDPMEICNVAGATVTGAGATALTGQNGIEVAFGATGHVRGSVVSANRYTGASSTNDWYANGYSATGVLLYDPAAGTTVQGSTVFRNQIGIALYDDGLSANGYLGPVNVTFSRDRVFSSDGYGIVANGAPGGNDSATVSATVVNNLAAKDPTVWGAPAILVDSGTFSLIADKLAGASVDPGASNGPDQIVCGPDTNNGTGTPFLSCAANTTITTAAIQGVSESVGSPTHVLIVGPIFVANGGHKISTLGVLGGAVNLRVLA